MKITEISLQKLLETSSVLVPKNPEKLTKRLQKPRSENPRFRQMVPKQLQVSETQRFEVENTNRNNPQTLSENSFSGSKNKAQIREEEEEEEEESRFGTAIETVIGDWYRKNEIGGERDKERESLILVGRNCRKWKVVKERKAL
ncbi:hypothetical protein TorRG33x02_224810 [Trema orientale]|uniref:Uncharacterized protein n=1 Tax=Trema orientale TaxID=63057 RepID=A0A2P5E8A0_TREOI|nr:hypothetical protein TorRG33x02_224810 [Trema orientale]